MFYREYLQQEDGRVARNEDLARMKSGFIPEEVYKQVHQSVPIICHDALVDYNQNILLVNRLEKPAQGVLSPIGGRALRGVPLIESMLKKIKNETNLDVKPEDLTMLGMTRQFWTDFDPFNHGHGTDTFTFIFYAKGRGELRLNSTLSQPTLLSPEDYTSKFRESLHPYTQDSIDLAIPFLRRER